MAGGVRVTGLDELREALRNLPAESTTEATRIAETAANAAAFEMRSVYGAHARSGKLQRSVVVQRRVIGTHIAAVVVRVKSPLAHLFEYGTQARHTAIGANRGSMPATPVVGRTAPKHRRRMFESLKAMLTRAGAVVTGDA